MRTCAVAWLFESCFQTCPGKCLTRVRPSPEPWSPCFLSHHSQGAEKAYWGRGQEVPYLKTLKMTRKHWWQRQATGILHFKYSTAPCDWVCFQSHFPKTRDTPEVTFPASLEVDRHTHVWVTTRTSCPGIWKMVRGLLVWKASYLPALPEDPKLALNIRKKWLCPNLQLHFYRNSAGKKKMP